MGRRPENTLIFTTDPFVGFMPTDLRAWIKDNHTDLDLATALAEVNNHVGLLGHELDEVNDPWLLVWIVPPWTRRLWLTRVSTRSSPTSALLSTSWSALLLSTTSRQLNNF